MTQPTDPSAEPPDAGLVQRRPRLQQWGILAAASAALGVLFETVGLPAALLLGPMIAGIALSGNGGSIRVPKLPVTVAQAVVGCLVARAITGDIVLTFLNDWPLFLGVVLAMVATSSAIGWTMGRYGVVTGTTALWGTAPGAAAVMMVLAGAFGADARLVAFMQYLRVVIVAGLASVVARVWIGPAAAASAIAWFPAVAWPDFGATLAVVGLGAAAGLWTRIPAGALLVPLVVGGLMEGSGLAHITLPPWLLALCYAFLGWSVGLGFSRPILAHAWRALPLVLLSIFVMIAMCAALAFVLVQAAGVDPLSAYLATSPGGMDTVAVIAASSTNVDLPFVMALQTVRFLIVLFAGPPLARLIAQRMG